MSPNLSFPRLILLFLAGTLGAATMAQADSVYMKTGTWEMRIKMSSESGQLEQQLEQMQKQLEALPEAQREMAKQSMPFQTLTGEPHETCVTEEDVADPDFNFTEESDCEPTVTRDGNDTHIELDCPNSATKGDFRIEDGEHYTGRVDTQSQFPGVSGQVTIEIAGEFIEAGCSEELRSKD